MKYKKSKDVPALDNKVIFNLQECKCAIHGEKGKDLKWRAGEGRKNLISLYIEYYLLVIYNTCRKSTSLLRHLSHDIGRAKNRF